ncbi:phage protease [Bowmanella denitrificans]|uniref:phage protease n=1 Tax=Bowmanella denitrificans TaxID=366582 RepID=UPI000C9AD6A9|nr:phage protease [Bowmanella denitrificans]
MKKHQRLYNFAYPGVGYVTATPAAALSVAALSNQEQPLGIAACSFAIVPNQSWQQILPGQPFAAKDGRPLDVPSRKWNINDELGPRLAALLNSRAAQGQELLFDYEHQTLLTKVNGQDAPASGWGKQFEWRPGQGLFAQLKYTPRAKQNVADEEYRFFSPVVIYDTSSGDVVDLHSVAITNDPAVLGMQAAALNNRFATPQEKPMNQALALLLSFIGVDVDTSKDIDAAALKATLESKEVEQKLAELKTKVDSNNEQTTQIAALKADLANAKAGQLDMSQFVPVETYNAVITEMAALKASNDGLTVDQVIDKAQQEGRFIAQAELTYLKELGQKQGVAALKATLDSRPAIAALGGQQQTTQAKPDADDKTGTAALTADQKAIADQLGISHADYAKELTTDQA